MSSALFLLVIQPEEHGTTTHHTGTATQHKGIIRLYRIHLQTHTTDFLQLVHPQEQSKISEVGRDK